MSDEEVVSKETMPSLKRKLAVQGRSKYWSLRKQCNKSAETTRHALDDAYHAEKYTAARELFADWMMTMDICVDIDFQTRWHAFEFRFTTPGGITISVCVPGKFNYRVFVRHHRNEYNITNREESRGFLELAQQIDLPRAFTERFIVEFVMHLIMDIADPEFPRRTCFDAPELIAGQYYIGPTFDRKRAFFQCPPAFANTAGWPL